MVSRLKDVYGVLPSPVRGAAASSFGWYLRWWRYGRDTEYLVEEARNREMWSEDEWAHYQGERLAFLLDRAATRVPFYREQWRARREAGDASSHLELKNWPILEKASLRSDARAFVADDVRLSSLFRLSTSGTSGSPITTWRSRRTMQAWYALFEARTRHWYGVDRRMPWALLGGQVVTPAAQTEPPFWIWNAALRQLYMSALHLAPPNVADYLDALRRYRVQHIYGYASSMYWLARMVQDQGMEAPRLLVAVSNAEPLHPHQRELIGGVFQCPVRDTYGMSEIVAAATECDHGILHGWPDVGIVEVLQDGTDAEVPPGTVGRLVCTGLLNHDMPLVRYEVGDRGALSASIGRCACGRTLPRFAGIEGRTSDNLTTADGRRVFWVNPVFYELPVREAQVIQETLQHIRVRVVPDDGYDPSVGTVIEQRLRQRLGEIAIEVEVVDVIERSANGKFRPVINRVDQHLMDTGTSGSITDRDSPRPQEA